MVKKAGKKPLGVVSDALVNALAGRPSDESGDPVTTPELATEVETSVTAEVPAEPEKTAEEPKKEDSPVAKDSELVAHLKGELANLTTNNAQLIRDNANLQAEVTGLKTKFDSLEVVAKSAYDGLRVCSQRFAVALGMTVAGIESMSGEVLITQFNNIKTAFDKRFLSGGKADAKAEEAKDSPATSNSVRNAGLRAVSSL